MTFSSFGDVKPGAARATNVRRRDLPHLTGK
jgi:hypothetical protein